MIYDITGSYKKTKKIIRRVALKQIVNKMLFVLGVPKYKINSLYLKEYGKKPDLNNPKTYSEKLLFLKEHYRNPLQTLCADKYYASEYVKACGYDSILRKIYKVYHNPNEIKFDDLPDKFFIRCNNRSGLNFCVDKNNVEEKTIHKLFSVALKYNYYYSNLEWPYKNIEPCVICEEVLENKDKSALVDYKFYCFDGKPEYFMVSYGEYEHEVRNLKYDMSGNNIDYMFKKEPNIKESEIKLPDNLDEMIEIVNVLCKPFPHVRVDLYNIDGKIYFGELTFYSNAGIIGVYSKEYDLKLGSLIDLDKYRNDYI